jgi:hypothetical protein
MSFALTKRQYLDHSKTVTRRMGWLFLQAGDWFMGIEKGMGLKKGERQVELGPSKAVHVRREPLSFIRLVDVRREGFPGMTQDEFVRFFCRANRCKPDAVVTRIEFRQSFPPRKDNDDG